ncbi:molybdenum cofactor guanylyltransferase MobA [Aestuariispira insulae]|uniref:Molybdenum cofactor guanylyltransferase n=1 Tax=Aestuariispira insulae TaxID=1461337 RepID=A0A3D9HSC9_9PROT|nr:molybdenum cofactor guanylyltransferase MobA [Aestuariispira insulae]RED52325.1 molybdenum cofactor guanylyltransferase [Aestuariispira insulae]
MTDDFFGPVLGLVLAGGLARRMGGGDKCLRMLGGEPILGHILDRLAPQVDGVVLNANGDQARFDAFGLPVASDVVEGFAGPLAGVLTGLDWAAANRPDVKWMVSVPGDGPFLPRDLIVRFKAAVIAEGADLACATRHGRTQPVVGLWRVDLREDLRRAMLEEDLRKVDLWTARHRLVEVAFDEGDVDPFFNTNRQEDLAEAERLISSSCG